eukprot:scaffold27070_cov147-Skeletonema_menzelii.AAC.13
MRSEETSSAAVASLHSANSGALALACSKGSKQDTCENEKAVPGTYIPTYIKKYSMHGARAKREANQISDRWYNYQSS